MVPPSVAPIDQNELLTVALLTLSPDIAATEVRPHRICVKYLPGRQYLVVTPEQWTVLLTFREARTAPQALCELISTRRSIPLRDYYELLVKAFAAGLLQVPGQPVPPAVPPVEWRFKTRGKPVRHLALLTMAVASVLIALRPLPMPAHLGHLLAGWLLTCLAVSLGNLLAACTLRGAGGEVHNPRLNWRSLWPGFVVDLEDKVTLAREPEITLALARLAPSFLITCLVSLYAPPLVLPLVFALLVQLCPLARTPFAALLSALYHDPRLTTTYDLKFVQNQLLLVLLRAKLKFADRRFLIACANFTVIWLALVFFAGCALLHANAWDLILSFNASGGFKITALVLLIVMAGMVLAVAGLMGWILWCHFRDWLEPRLARRRLLQATPPVDTSTVLRCIADTHLFRSLPPEDQQIIADQVTAEGHENGAIVVRQGAIGDRLYLLFSGAVEVLREQAVGRPEVVAELLPGEVFGEMALLRDGVRTRSVRCTRPTVLLSLTREAFEGLVLSRLSRDAVEASVQKVAFLHRIELSRHWSPTAMSAFARRARFQDFTVGDLLVRQGDSNQYFHLVHEGELTVEKTGREIARLGVGDFFGELSLLQNSAATAAVVAATPGRCLVMGKREFLDFITRDFLIGLQFEQISSSRIGRPLFPLADAAFDDARLR